MEPEDEADEGGVDYVAKVGLQSLFALSGCTTLTLGRLCQRALEYPARLPYKPGTTGRDLTGGFISLVSPRSIGHYL